MQNAPEDAGFDPSRLNRLERFLDRLAAEGVYTGSLMLISRAGQVVHLSCHGQRAADDPVQPDTIWRIFSMTKPITSVAVLMLWEEGLLSLSDPIEKFIPSFANGRVYQSGTALDPDTVPAIEPIRVRHLLTHTSGLSYGFAEADPVNDAYRATGFYPGTSNDFLLADACDCWAALPLLFQPGSEWNYSVATDVAGRIVEVASGMPLDRFFAERIFAPLRMPDTGFGVPEAERWRRAVLHVAAPRTGRAVPATDGPFVTADVPRFLSGGGGLFSTAADYHRFAQMLLRRGELDGARLLAPRTVDLMATNHLPGGATMLGFGRPPGDPHASLEGFGFGLGVAPLIDRVSIGSLSSPGEYGWTGAAGTVFWVDPAEELTVVFLTQTMGSTSSDAVRVDLRRLVYGALVT